jgi:hypothetical protein
MQEMESASSALVCHPLLVLEVCAIDRSRHLDSGGPGTYSQLLILKECMVRLATDLGVSEDDVYPADHFDLMGGVGFGGYACIVFLCDGLLFVFSDLSPSYLDIFA